MMEETTIITSNVIPECVEETYHVTPVTNNVRPEFVMEETTMSLLSHAM